MKNKQENMLEILGENVLPALRQRRSLEETDASQDEEIFKMSQDEMFTEWLAWHGLSGWESTILTAINDIRDAHADSHFPDEWPFSSEIIYL